MTKTTTHSAPQAPRSNSTISTVAAILRCFTVDEPECGVTEIAEAVGLHKSSVSRTLRTLEAERMVAQNPETKKYRLNWGLLSIVGPLLSHLDLRSLAYPTMKELAEQTRETVSLCVFDGVEAIVVEQVQGTEMIRHVTPIGTRYLSLAHATVRVFHAWGGGESGLKVEGVDEVQPAVLGWSKESYDQHCAEIRERLYAVNNRDSNADEVGIASPIFDHRGGIVGALLLAAPAFRTSEERIDTLCPAVREAAETVGRSMGFTPENFR